MSAAGLVALRAGEIVAEVRMAALGVSPRDVERAVHRVLRARGRRMGDGFAYPPIAVLFLSPVHFRRLAPMLEAHRPEIEQRIAERLDQDRPVPLQLHIRRDARVRRLQVAAPAVREVVPVRRRSRHHDPDRTLLEPTQPDPAQRAPRPSGLVLQPRDGGPPISIPEEGITLGRGDLGLGRIVDRRVSREHTELISAAPDRLLCRDLRSRNGTWVDGTRISRAVDLRMGQRLRVGGTEFLVVRHNFTVEGGDE